MQIFKSPIKFLVFLFLFVSDLALAARFQGQVAAIHDGDTINITLSDSNRMARVRLLGTDSPEVEVNRQTQGEAALRARDYLRAMLPIGAVVIINTTDEDVTDKHNRLLGQVMYEGVDMNREMLRSGWSAFYLIAPFDKTMAKQYSQVSKEAYEARRGIFSAEFSNVLMPYMFRLKVMGHVGRNLIGNLETKELYANEDVDLIPPYARVFFPSEQSANSRGYSFQ
ncbi:Endonuclease YhcR precursor [compost metagenome]